LDLAAKFGYTTLTDRDRYGLSLVLGGGEVKLLNTSMPMPLCQRGYLQRYVAVLEVKDPKGQIIEKAEETMAASDG